MGGGEVTRAPGNFVSGVRGRVWRSGWLPKAALLKTSSMSSWLRLYRVIASVRVDIISNSSESSSNRYEHASHPNSGSDPTCRVVVVQSRRTWPLLRKISSIHGQSIESANAPRPCSHSAPAHVLAPAVFPGTPCCCSAAPAWFEGSYPAAPYPSLVGSSPLLAGSCPSADLGAEVGQRKADTIFVQFCRP